MAANRASAFVAAVVAIVAGTAHAASAGKDPMTLILRQGDLPRGAIYEADDDDNMAVEEAIADRDIAVDEASYWGSTYSKAKGSVAVTGVVFVAGNIGAAKKVFPIAKKRRDVFWKNAGPTTAPVVPRFGDQQHARISPPDAGTGIGSVELIVRKKSIVWLLNVNIERRPARSKAELLGELKTYARKQQRRIGTG
jgi:hypothetical protein